jgi:hypothetical protein
VGAKGVGALLLRPLEDAHFELAVQVRGDGVPGILEARFFVAAGFGLDAVEFDDGCVAHFWAGTVERVSLSSEHLGPVAAGKAMMAGNRQPSLGQ